MSVEWNVEEAERAEFNLPNVATLHFDSCGLNLTCLDQCHGVRSHGTSSSQGWRKIIFMQSIVKTWSMNSTTVSFVWFLANSVSDVFGCSTHLEQEKGCPYPALATPQLRKPPKAGVKELSYSLQSKFDPWVYTLVSTKCFLQVVCQGKPSQLTKLRAYGIQKELPLHQKRLEIECG